MKFSYEMALSGDSKRLVMIILIFLLKLSTFNE